MKRVLKKKPLALTSVRLPSEDVEAWRAAAAKLEISQSEFLRRALRGISQQTLDEPKPAEVKLFREKLGVEIDAR
jgi:Arc/MetJ-type ribon-helix-helix transcriptional regulator